LSASSVGRTTLFILPNRTSPGWVRVLEKWGPWPAELLPVKIGTTDARVISRTARPDEIKALSERISRNGSIILKELTSTGASRPKIAKTENGIGTVVHQDIAHAVLRREFGMDGSGSGAHWRPALREVVDAVPAAMERFKKYIVTGRESSFLLPDIDDQITINQLRGGVLFVRELAPFVPQR